VRVFSEEDAPHGSCVRDPRDESITRSRGHALLQTDLGLAQILALVGLSSSKGCIAARAPQGRDLLQSAVRGEESLIDQPALEVDEPRIQLTGATEVLHPRGAHEAGRASRKVGGTAQCVEEDDSDAVEIERVERHPRARDRRIGWRIDEAGGRRRDECHLLRITTDPLLAQLGVGLQLPEILETNGSRDAVDENVLRAQAQEVPIFVAITGVKHAHNSK